MIEANKLIACLSLENVHSSIKEVIEMFEPQSRLKNVKMKYVNRYSTSKDIYFDGKRMK